MPKLRMQVQRGDGSRYAGKGRGLCDEIRLGRVDYGDPPNIVCCDIGMAMSSVMHRVLEYWSRDLAGDSRWQRDPAFEGPVTEVHEQADTVSELLAAVVSGATAIRVMCTSNPNRYDLAGRAAAALAAKGRVLVTFAPTLVFVVGKMLDGLVPENAVGNVRQARSITLAPFDRLSEVPPGTMDTIIVLAGPSLSERAIQDAKNAAERLWRETARWLESVAGRVLIEFALAGRRRMIECPGVVIDGWQMRARTA
jgi:hypothetical protein